MTPKEEHELLTAKIQDKREKLLFLMKKLIKINWFCFIMWVVAVTLEFINEWHGSFNIDSELFKVAIVGIILTMPIVFVAEGIGIYRKFGVIVNLEESQDLFKGDKNKEVKHGGS